MTTNEDLIAEHSRTSCKVGEAVNAEPSGNGCLRCNEVYFEKAKAAVAENARLLMREIVGYMTHHDEPMLFLTHAEAAAYCDDNEEPIPLCVHAPVAVTADEYVPLTEQDFGVMHFGALDHFDVACRAHRAGYDQRMAQELNKGESP